MSVCLVGTSTLASLFKLIALLIVFILILVASYFFTKWYAKAGMTRIKSGNIQVVESFPIAQGKQISILKIGEKYIAVAVCKEQITFLTELTEEQLSLEIPPTANTDFSEVFQKIRKQQWKKEYFGKKDRKG